MFYEDSTARDKITAQLQETEKSLQQYMEIADVITRQPFQGLAIIQGDPPRIVFANQTISDILGQPVDTITRLDPQQLQSILFPDDQQRFFQDYRDRLQGKTVDDQYEFRMLRPDGSVIWVELYAQRIHFKGQTAVLVIIQNITNRKQIESARQEAENRYRTLFEDSRDAIFITTIDGHFLDVNQAMLDLFGYRRDEFFTLNAVDTYYNPSDRRLFQAAMEKNGAVRDYEIRLKKKDGTAIDCLLTCTARYDANGHMVGYQGVIRDITERKKEEQALQESETQYRTTINAMGDAIHVVDKNLKILMINDSFVRWCRELGIDIARTDKSVFDLFPFLPKKVQDEYQQVIKTGQILITEETTRIGNQLLITETRKIPIFEGNQVVRILTIIRDITEKEKTRKEIIENYAKMRRILEETTFTLASTVEKRDPYTAGHQQRVAKLARAIAAEIGMLEEEIEGIKMAALIHDIGKIYVPAEILNKPGRLTEIEYNLIKTHPQLGYDILKAIEFPWPVARIILQHHERLNGSGYPHALTAADIIKEAKILMVADVVEAIFSNRPYRPARGIDKAIEEIIQNRDILYDPMVVDACLELFNKKNFKFE